MVGAIIGLVIAFFTWLVADVSWWYIPLSTLGGAITEIAARYGLGEEVGELIDLIADVIGYINFGD